MSPNPGNPQNCKTGGGGSSALDPPARPPEAPPPGPPPPLCNLILINEAWW